MTIHIFRVSNLEEYTVKVVKRSQHITHICKISTTIIEKFIFSKHVKGRTIIFLDGGDEKS